MVAVTSPCCEDIVEIVAKTQNKTCVNEEDRVLLEEVVV